MCKGVGCKKIKKCREGYLKIFPLHPPGTFFGGTALREKKGNAIENTSTWILCMCW